MVLSAKSSSSVKLRASHLGFGAVDDDRVPMPSPTIPTVEKWLGTEEIAIFHHREKMCLGAQERYTDIPPGQFRYWREALEGEDGAVQLFNVYEGWGWYRKVAREFMPEIWRESSLNDMEFWPASLLCALGPSYRHAGVLYLSYDSFDRFPADHEEHYWDLPYAAGLINKGELTWKLSRVLTDQGREYLVETTDECPRATVRKLEDTPCAG